MTENTEDVELKAMKVLLSALSDLDGAARQRVLAYVFTRLDLQPPVTEVESGLVETDTTEVPASSVRRPRGVVPTIIEFKEAKKPRSANEMAAVLAYFLQYEAPADERKDTVNKADLDRYFHLAKFRKPKDANFTLVNSKNAGYLDQRGRGGICVESHRLQLGCAQVGRRRPNIRKQQKGETQERGYRP
jgi:hypothetical protein